MAGRLADWDLTVALATRSLHLERWVPTPMQVACCLALYARALAEDQPELAGVLHGAAYATFRRAASEAGGARQSGTEALGRNTNFVLTALREAGDIIAAALGDERLRELRAVGRAMTMDEAIAHALTNIDPRLRT